MKTKNTFITDIIYIIILYLFLYDPPMFFLRDRLAPSYLLSYAAVLLFAVNSKVIFTFYKSYSKEMLILFFLFLFSMVRSLPSGGMNVIATHLYCLIRAGILIPFLLYYLKPQAEVHDKIIRLLLYVCTIATFFSILCIIMPSFNQFVRDRLIQYSYDDYLFNSDSRGFGIAGLLTSNFGYVQGAIIALGIVNIKNNKWFLFVIPFALISILVNARTGILVAGLGFLMLLMQRKNFKYLILVFVIFLVLYLIGIEGLFSMLGISSETYYWIVGFQDEVEMVAESGDISSSGTANKLFDDMWVMPETTGQWLLGRGFLLYRNEHGITSSDVGWINQLNYGGIFYLATIIFLILYMARKLAKNKQGLIGMFIMLSFAIINTKSRCYPGASFLSLLFLIYYISLMGQKPIWRHRKANRLVRR